MTNVGNERAGAAAGTYQYDVLVDVGVGSGSLTLVYDYANPTAVDIAAAGAPASSGGNYMIKTAVDLAAVNVVVDTRGPVPTITLSDPVLKLATGAGANGEMSVVTVAFDETPFGFGIDDISVDPAVGALSGFTATADPKVFKVNFTAAAGQPLTTARFTIRSGAESFADALGNVSSLDASATFTVDTSRPVLSSISRLTTERSITNSDTLTFRAVFTEAMRNASVDVNDFRATGTSGTVASVTAVGTDGTTWDVVVSGGDLATYNGVVGLVLADAPTLEDRAFSGTGNTLDTAASASASALGQTYVLDNVAPTVTSVVMSDRVLKSGETTLVRITFSDAIDPATFTASDIQTTGGSISGLALASDGLSATATFTPTANLVLANGSVIIGSAFKDLAGNDASSGAQIDVRIETVLPTVTSIAKSTDAQQLDQAVTFVVRFSESVRGVDAADFLVNNGGGSTLTTASVTAVTPANLVDGAATDWLVTVSGGNIAEFNGRIGLSIASNVSIFDNAFDASIIGDTGNAVQAVQPASIQYYQLTNLFTVNDSVTVTQDGSAAPAVVSGVLANDAGVSSVGRIKTSSGAYQSLTADGATIVTSYGSLTIKSDGSYTYTANGAASKAIAKDATAADVFVYEATTPLGTAVTANLIITIVGLNDTPVAAATKTLNVNEDSSVSDTVGATDIDRDAIVYTIKAGATAAHGLVTLDATSGALTYTPAANYNGTDTFTILATDAYGASFEQVVTVNVASVNDTPVIGAATTRNATLAETNLTLSASGQIVATDVDGDALSASAGTASVTASGVTLTPEQRAAFGSALTVGANGAWNFGLVSPDLLPVGSTVIITRTVTVSDGHGGTASTDIVVTLTGANDAPVVAATASLTLNEDASVAHQVTATDVDGDVLNYAIKTGANAAHGVVTLNAATGALTYAPIANYNGADTFTILVTDAFGATAEQVVTVNVTPVNDAPVIGASTTRTASLVESGVAMAASGQIVATDVDGDALTVSASSPSVTATGVILSPELEAAFAAALTVGADGAWTFGPFLSEWLPDPSIVTITRTVTITDGSGRSATTDVVVTIAGINSAPVVAATKALSVSEDGSVSDAVAATDAEGGAITYRIKTGANAAHGVVMLDASTGALTYAPAANYNGIDTFTIVVSDAFGATAEQVVTVNVASVNDAPVVGASTTRTASLVETNAALSASGQIVSTDGEGDTLSVSAAAASVTASGVTLTSAQQTAFASALTVGANGAWNFALASPDALPAGSTVTVTRTVTISDGRGGSTSADIVVTIDGSNDAPLVAATAGLTVGEDGSVAHRVVTSDAEGDAIVYTINANAAHGVVTLDAATGALTYAPAANYNGADTFTILATDARGASCAQVVTVNVGSINDAPVISPSTTRTASVVENNAALSAAGRVIASDVEGDTLSFTAAAASVTASGVTLTSTQQSAFASALTVAPDGSWNFALAASHVLPVGSAVTITRTVTVSDGHGGTATTDIVVTITGSNDAPIVAATASLTLNEDASVTHRVTASDAERDTLTYAIKTGANAAHGVVTLDAATGALTYAPAANYNGADTFTIRVTDTQGASSEQVVTVTVIAVNDAPVIGASTTLGASLVETNSALSATGRVVATDADGDTTSFSAAPASVTGTGVTLTSAQQTAFASALTVAADGAWSFALASPDALPVGSVVTVTRTVTVSDGHGGTAATDIVVTIEGVNDAPVVATAASLTTNEDISVSQLIGATDAEGDALTYSMKPGAAPAHGTVTINEATGALTYAPAANYNGIDTFTILAMDALGASSEQVVTVNVVSVNDAPVIDASTTRTAALVETNVALSASGQIVASDLDGDTLSVSAASASVTATSVNLTPAQQDAFASALTVGAHGAWDFALASPDHLPAGSLVTVTRTVTFSDGNGGTTSADIVMTISGANDAPVVDATKTLSMNEDGSVSDTVGATDIDGDAIVYTIKAGANAAPGIVTIDAATGAVSYAPAPNYNGTDTFTIVATDANGASAEQVVTVNIFAVNDAPVIGASSTLTEALVETNADLSASGLVAAADVDGDELTLSAAPASVTTTGVLLTTEQKAAFASALVVEADGTWTFSIASPDELPIGSLVTITRVVTVSDGQGGMEIANIVVTIAGSNDAPVIGAPPNFNNDAGTGSSPGPSPSLENGAPSIDTGSPTATLSETQSALSASGQLVATDVDGDTLTISTAPAVVTADGVSLTPTQQAQFASALTVDAYGAWTFALASPDALPVGSRVTITRNVTYSDGNGGVASTDIVVMVNGSNDAPTAAATAGLNLNEDGGGSHQVVAADAEGDALFYSIKAGAQHGLVTIVSDTGNVSYTPTANFNGTDSFVVVVTDSNGAHCEQTILVTVRPVNDAHAGTVTISGVAEPGRTLTASDNLADIDGVGTVAYQWYRDNQAISGATGARYVAGIADAQRHVSVKASYTDGDGTVETEASNAVLITSSVTPQTIQAPLLTPLLATYAAQPVRQMQVMNTVYFALAAKNADEIGKDRYTRAPSQFTNFGNLFDAGGANAGGPSLGRSAVKVIAVNRGPLIEIRLMSTEASANGEAVQLTGQQFEVVNSSGAMDKVDGSVFILRGDEKSEIILDIIQSDGRKVRLPIFIDPSRGAIELQSFLDDAYMAPSKFAALLEEAADPGLKALLASIAVHQFI